MEDEVDFLYEDVCESDDGVDMDVDMYDYMYPNGYDADSDGDIIDDDL